MVEKLDLDPIRAATAEDPYPYYERLVAERPFFFDDRIGGWVAASAAAVEAALSSPDLRVRPPSEPVPGAIVGTPVGDVFGRLVRMIDGSQHATLKSAVVSTIDHADWHAFATIAARCADSLADASLRNNRISLEAFSLRFPALVTATLLGLSHDDAEIATEWTDDFVRSVLPSASAETIACGDSAILALREALGSLAAERSSIRALLRTLLREGRKHELDDETLTANAIGFLFQAHDATAGLIGNTVIALSREPDAVRRSVLADRAHLERFVAEVARYDAPVQNTRRFAARDVSLMGSTVREGESVLVVVAAANRDPAANVEPHRFDPFRERPRMFTFGLGAHACPGMRLATLIAAAGVARLLRAGLPQHRLSWTYLQRTNVRVPVMKP